MIGPVDSVRILRLDAGLFTTTPSGCPPMGGEVQTWIWGDINCDGPDPVDSVLVLRFDAGLRVDVPPGCPGLGEPV